jgi:phage shock protein A
MSFKKLFAMLTGQGQAAIDSATMALEAANPEVAIKVDKQEIEDNLRTIAISLAQAEEKLKAEEAEVVVTQAKIDKDLKAAEILIGQGNEDKANILMSEVEKLKNTMAHEKRERDSALLIVKNFHEAKDKLLKTLNEYDEKSSEVVSVLQEAKSERESAKAIRESEALSSSQTNLTNVNSSLASMTAMAAKLRAQADVDRTMTDLNKPVAEKDSDIAAALAQVETGSATKETATERLARLRG